VFILALAAAGGNLRFEALVRTHEPTLSRLAHRLCKNPSDAHDLVQDTFERALRRLDQLTPGTNEAGWLVTIQHHLFIDRCRKAKRQPRAEDIDDVQIAAPEPAAPEPAWAKLGPEDVRAALGQLGDDFRRVYELACVEGKSYQEIADLLGVPKATVGTRLIRARRRLKEILVPKEGAP
jgi:RNA polymerase sigma-70 factor (ECF subfamily)